MIELSDRQQQIIDAAIVAIVKRGIIPTTRGIREQIIKDQGSGLSLQTIHPAYQEWHQHQEQQILGLIDVEAINQYRDTGPVHDALTRRTLSRLAERKAGVESAAAVIKELREMGTEQ